MKWTAVFVALAACRTFQTVETGHKGLLFEPDPAIGVKREVLPEGRYKLGSFCGWLGHACGKIVDFDVTFTTSHEQIKTVSKDGLALDLELAIIYKPIVAELYELATEVTAEKTGDYYAEVVRPEFHSAASAAFAKHLYTELGANKEKIEDEIEADVQRRIKGKHVAIASITIEHVLYAPEILAANQARIVSEQENLRQRAAMEQDAARQKAQLENDALKQKLAQEHETSRMQQEIQNRSAEQKLELERQLESKKNERLIAEEDAKLEKAKAAATVVKARADAEAITILARAHAEENRAATQAISPLTVQMKAYEALGQLGGSGTTILLGDYSKLPTFLFPPGFMGGAYPSHVVPASRPEVSQDQPVPTHPTSNRAARK